MTLRFLLITALIFHISACSSFLDLSITSFHQGDVPLEGKVFVAAENETLQSSLAFNHYKALLENKLLAQGYTITAESDADFIVSIDYGSEKRNPVNPQVSSPSKANNSGFNTSISIGRSSRGRHGSVGISTGVSSPSTQVSNSTAYIRFLQLSFFSVGATEQALYQATVKSRGECGEINSVFEAMLFALFIDFPAENAKTTMLQVEGEERC